MHETVVRGGASLAADIASPNNLSSFRKQLVQLLQTLHARYHGRNQD